jgi:hypothetical protein
MSEINIAVLTVLIKAACDLHEPGEDAGEYTRGQAELIADACGLRMVTAHEVLQPLLSSGRSHHDIRRAVIRAEESA